MTADLGDAVTARRIQLSRRKGWRPEGAVLVSRPSRWGNPFVVRGRAVVIRGVSEWLTWETCSSSVHARAFAVDAYDAWLGGSYPSAFVLDGSVGGAEGRRELILTGLDSLRGRDLACWCPLDHLCHADVLIRRANT